MSQVMSNVLDIDGSVRHKDSGKKPGFPGSGAKGIRSENSALQRHRFEKQRTEKIKDSVLAQDRPSVDRNRELDEESAITHNRVIKQM